MKISPYVEKLEKSQEYKDFHKKYKDAFMAAGFFVLDLETSKNVHQLDFYVPSEKKIAAFSLDGDIKVQLLEAMNEKIPDKLDIKVKTDLDALYGILEDEMKNRGITEEIKKIVAVLQNIDGKVLWNLNCILSGMEILRANVDDESRSVLKMEKFSMLDLIKKVPGKALGNLGALQGKPEGKVTKTQVKDELKQIDKVEAALEKEKKELEKMVSKTEKVKGSKIDKNIKKELKKEIKEAEKIKKK